MPDERVDARLFGRGVVARHPRKSGDPWTPASAGVTVVPFTLALSLTRPANDALFAAQGMLGYAEGKTRLASQVRVSGPLHFGDDGLRVAPLRFSADARYIVGNTTNVPFVFALSGPLRVQGATIALSPAGVALRGGDLVPDIDARAAFAYAKDASLHLDGRIATWPDAWPALPPPIGQSASPLPFVLDYTGPFDFSDIARLQLARDDTRFDGRFRLPDVLAWIDATPASPLPPLAGTVRTP